MSPLPSWRRYLRFWGKDLQRDVDDELRFHLESRYEEYVAMGISPEHARAEAQHRFGDVGDVRDRCVEIDTQWEREQTMSETLHTVVSDLRYALRQIRRGPALATAAILCFALGISANTSIFTVVNGVLFRPLPFADPDRLVLVSEGLPKIGTTSTGRISAADYLDFQNTPGSTFASIGIFGPTRVTLSGEGDPVRAQATQISASLFRVLGVHPAFGRDFATGEDAVGAAPAVILSQKLWRERYRGDSALVGRTITVNGAPATVVGVMPVTFAFPFSTLGTPADLYVPYVLGPQELELRGDLYDTFLLGRLAPGVSMERAHAAVNEVTRRFSQLYPSIYKEPGMVVATIQPLREEIVGGVRTALLVLLAAVGFVLLIACINVSSLLLARAATRQREVAVRRALGATRRRLAQQFLAESLVLVGIGGALGVLLAQWGARTLVALDPAQSIQSYDVSLDWRVLAFTAGVTALTGVVFSLLPGLQGPDATLHDSLREDGRSSGSPSRLRTRRGLVVAEIALALVLAIGAGLMIKSFVRLRSVDPGFDPQHLLTFRISLPASRYPEMRQVFDFDRRLDERLRQIPGVERVSNTTHVPLGGQWMITFTPEGAALPKVPVAFNSLVLPGYFETMRIPLRAGRTFTPQDRSGAPLVTVVSESMARRFWPNEDAVGKRLRWGTPQSTDPWQTVIGVVSDVKQGGLDRDQPLSIYMPTMQHDTGLVTSLTRNVSVVVRSSGDPSQLINPVRAVVRELDPELPVTGMGSVDELLVSSMSTRRFNMLLLGTFAALALALAAIGIYGLMAYSVVQRTREIGIRLAIGASPSDVLRLVVGQGAALAVAGVAIGLAGSVLLTRVLRSLLFEVSPIDPLTFGLVSGLLVAVTVLASFLPARRASRIDPQVAIRNE